MLEPCDPTDAIPTPRDRFATLFPDPEAAFRSFACGRTVNTTRAASDELVLRRTGTRIVIVVNLEN